MPVLNVSFRPWSVPLIQFQSPMYHIPLEVALQLPPPMFPGDISAALVPKMVHEKMPSINRCSIVWAREKACWWLRLVENNKRREMHKNLTHNDERLEKGPMSPMVMHCHWHWHPWSLDCVDGETWIFVSIVTRNWFKTSTSINSTPPIFLPTTVLGITFTNKVCWQR